MQKSNSLGQTCMEWQTESFFFLGWQRYMDIPTKFLLPPHCHHIYLMFPLPRMLVTTHKGTMSLQFSK